MTPSQNQPESVQSDSVRIPWKVLIVGIAVLALAAFVITQVAGVLYGIAFPPLPPVPEGVKALSHVNTAYGIDEWLYGTDADPCEVLAFYQDRGGECSVAAQSCDSGVSAPGISQAGEHIARCLGQQQFSIFAMRWQTIIAGGYQTDGQTHFRVVREIFWTGTVPPMPTPGQQF